MKLLIEVANQDEFVELLKELQWQERNGKLEDTLDGYQAAADNLRGMAARWYMESQAIERPRCTQVCDKLTEEYRQLLRAANECNHRDRVAAYVARIEALAEALEMIRGEG